MTLGQNIKRARARAKLRQAELGIACGWGEDSQTRVSNYENDKREPTLNDLRAIARATGCSLMELIEGLDDSPTAELARKIHRLRPGAQERVIGIVDEFLGSEDSEK
jgi:transcriptional regulator with XRE-family HTH domain